MTVRDLIHVFLGIPALVAIGVVLTLFVRAGESDVSAKPPGQLTSQAWEKILSAIPAKMPGEYEDETEPNSDEFTDAEKEAYAETNAYIVSCAFLVLLGVIGLAAMGLPAGSVEPLWNPFLRTGTLLAFTLVSFLLVGFNLAFPGDEAGIFPFPSFHLPGEISSIEYDLNGISEWADLLFTGMYSALFAAMLLSFSSRGVHSAPLFLIAFPAAALFFPIVLSWKWGGGWADQLLNNYDFAGAALLHWHCGAVALLIGLVLTLAPLRTKGVVPVEPTATPGSAILFLVGGIGYLLALIAINAGSTLDADPAIAAPVLQATLLAGGVAGFLGLLWGLLSPTRSFLRFCFLGAAAGIVAVSGGADLMTRNDALVFGILAGLVIPGLVFLSDRMGWVDPLSIGFVHGVGGVIGVIGTPFVGQDAESTLPGQFILLFTTPILSLGMALVTMIVAGAIGYLFISGEAGGRMKDPPPLPGAS